MEEIMTHDGTSATTLSSWWDNVVFIGKEHYELRENGELALKAVGTSKERVVGTMTLENADIVLKALLDKFPEVQAKMNDLQAEWDATDDKQRMVGKVERMKEYLKHTNAAGDFKTLFAPLISMSNALDALSEENYNAKVKLVEAAETAAGSDNWKETTHKLKEFTDQWKAIGYVDKHKSDELWNRLEIARNKFFERKRQNHEDVEKDMLQNLDLKMELVEKAEALADSEEWKNTTEIFRQLMEDWKKLGRTIPEKNEELWNKFINAKNNFYDRKKVHFETIQQEQEVNQQLKEALIIKAEELKDSQEWNATSQAYADLMEQWKAIGRVPVEKSEELWGRFNAVREHFFQAKRQHFETVKVSLDDNYAQKMALLKRAEMLQNSKQWREATVEMNELMIEWKKVGPVPREQSNLIWEQFINARKKFFERKDEDRENRLLNAEKQRISRTQQMHDFVQKLEEELKEEQDKLDDFTNGINNITPGHKEVQLREHLQKLIAQTENKIKHKQEKLEDVRKQMGDFKDKNTPKHTDTKE